MTQPGSPASERGTAFTLGGGKPLVTTKGNTGAIEVFDVNALGGASLDPVVTSLHHGPGAGGRRGENRSADDTGHP